MSHRRLQTESNNRRRCLGVRLHAQGCSRRALLAFEVPPHAVTGPYSRAPWSFWPLPFFMRPPLPSPPEHARSPRGRSHWAAHELPRGGACVRSTSSGPFGGTGRSQSEKWSRRPCRLTLPMPPCPVHFLEEREHCCSFFRYLCLLYGGGGGDRSVAEWHCPLPSPVVPPAKQPDACQWLGQPGLDELTL